jgi:hypothetical protein
MRSNRKWDFGAKTKQKKGIFGRFIDFFGWKKAVLGGGFGGVV